MDAKTTRERGAVGQDAHGVSEHHPQSTYHLPKGEGIAPWALAEHLTQVMVDVISYRTIERHVSPQQLRGLFVKMPNLYQDA